MTFGYPRVPAGFTLGLGPSRAWPVSKTSGTGTRKTSKKRLGRARARVGLRPVPPLFFMDTRRMDLGLLLGKENGFGIVSRDK